MTTIRKARPSAPRRERLKPFHIVMIGDVGGPSTFHVGDEAMLEANIARFRRWCPDIVITVLSHEPRFTAKRYGVGAIEPIAFPPELDAAAEREVRLGLAIQSVRMVADGAPPRDGSLGAVVAALAQADALVISGGGNLSSTWPQLLYERAALLSMADTLGIPSILLGQTLDGNLTNGDRDLLARTLPLARLVGVREKPSALLAHALGVPWERILYQLDDCFDLPLRPITDADTLRSIDTVGRPLVLVTVHPFAGAERCRMLARQLDAFAATSGAHLVFVPHEAGPDDHQPPADLAMGHTLKNFLRPETPYTLLGIRDGAELLWLTSRAEMVISTRYHPLVFATRTGVSALAVHTDDYTRTKLRGALHHADLERWSLPMDIALGGALLPAALELWQRRTEVHQHLAQRGLLWQAMQEQLKRQVTAALGLPPQATANRQPPLASSPNTEPRNAPLAPRGLWQTEVVLADGPDRRLKDEACILVFAHEQARAGGDMLLAWSHSPLSVQGADPLH